MMIFDGMVNGETNPELIEEIEDSFIEDYILLPGQYDINLQEKWYKYRDACYERVARDWCERFGIEIES